MTSTTDDTTQAKQDELERALYRPVMARLLHWFHYDHLPPALAKMSKRFHDLAHLVADLCEGDEAEEAVRKLLEAKDCAVRATLPNPMAPEEEQPTSDETAPSTEGLAHNLFDHWFWQAREGKAVCPSCKKTRPKLTKEMNVFYLFCDACRLEKHVRESVSGVKCV